MCLRHGSGYHDLGVKRLKDSRPTSEDFFPPPKAQPSFVRVLAKAKRNKSPGPDGLPMEAILEMDITALDEIVKLLNQWWLEKTVPPEALRARALSPQTIIIEITEGIILGFNLKNNSKNIISILVKLGKSFA